MVKRAARLSYPQIELEFHSEHSQYKITNDSGNDVGVAVGQNSGVLSNALVSFQTQNTLSDNIGTFSVVVSGQSIRWDKIINVNDIITIRVSANEVEAAQQDFNTNIFTGLVSEVGVIGQYGQDSLMFQISGQSFAKAFTQYKIGLVSQVQQLLSNMGWLWDTNAQLDPIVHGSGAGGGKGGFIPVGSYSKAVASKAKAVAKAVGGKLGIKPSLVFGQIGMETGMKETPLVKHNNLSGITYAHQKGASQGSHQPDGSMYYAYFRNLGYYAGTYYDILKRDLGGRHPKSASQMANTLHAAHYFTSDAASYARGISSWAAQYGRSKSSGKVSIGGGSSSGGGSDSSSDDDDTKGEVNSTEEMINREKNNSIGVAFFGNTVATVENNLVERFKPYMIYSYDNNSKTLWDFLDYSDMQSWTDYEYLLDSSQFANASGSLWDLLQSALAAPFNEMYFDSTADGRSKMIVRRTPFNPEDWSRLTQINIDSNDIIDYEISKTDLQQYSVFVVNPAAPTMLGIVDGTLLSAYPQTNLSLINIYGYSKYEADNLYLSGRGNDNNKDSSKDSDKDSKSKDKKGKGKSKGKSKGSSSSKKPKKNANKRPIADGMYPHVMSIDVGLRKAKATKSKSKGNTTKSGDPKKVKATKKKSGSGVQSSMDNSAGTYFKESDVAKYLKSINTTTLRLNKPKFAKLLADAANNISAAQAYDLINNYCANGYIMTQNTYDTVMQTDTGGGLPNTGTQEASYKNMAACIDKSGGDLNAFMSIAKSTIKNVSDEFLRQVWQARNSKGKLDKKAYEDAYKNYRNLGDYTGNSEATDLKFFTRMLFNWYADNFNYQGGTITVAGNPDIRVGCILNAVDFHTKHDYNYPGVRFYIESVTQKFSYEEGFTTSVEVTRGMKMPVGNGEDPRFTNLWGTSIDFKGGYMGEASIADLALATDSQPDDSGTDDSGAFGGAKGREVAVKAAKFGYTFRKDGHPKVNGRRVTEAYTLGAGHGVSKNPLTHARGTLELDCSSFVYWCFKHYGVTIGGITTSQLNDPQFKKVHVGQSSKNMKVGDLVFMENCGHVMFYIGNGKLMGWNGTGRHNTSGGCQIQTLATVRGWAHGIDGVVARLK